LEISKVTIPPMPMNTALRKIFSRENISAWFYATKCENCMKPPIEQKYTFWKTTAHFKGELSEPKTRPA